MFFHDLKSSEKEDLILLHCLQIYRPNMTIEIRYSETIHTHRIFFYSSHLPEWSFKPFGLDPIPRWCGSEYNLRSCGSPKDGGHFLQTFVERGSYEAESQKENTVILRLYIATKLNSKTGTFQSIQKECVIQHQP